MNFLEIKKGDKIRFLPNFDYASLYPNFGYKYVVDIKVVRKEKIKKILNKLKF